MTAPAPRGHSPAAELPALFLVVFPVEYVPLAASRRHSLRHPCARELIEAAIEGERVGEGTLGLVQEQAVVPDPSQLLLHDAAHEGMRQVREPSLGQGHRTNPRAFAIRCLTSCSTLRRSRSSRRTPGAPRRTIFSASAIASFS